MYMMVNRTRVMAAVSLLIPLLSVAVVEDQKNWDDFYPPPDAEFDWIQLTSGEWLKGDLKVLYNYTLEFDSDELDLLKFDFDDVEQLRTRNAQTILVETGDGQTRLITGTLHLKHDHVEVWQQGMPRNIDRDQLISIADGSQSEWDLWSGMASLGVNARSGNTESVDTTVMANIKRRSARMRFITDYLSNYSKSESDTIANNQRLNSYYDWFLTSRFYWRVLSFEYFRDPFSNIQGQYSIGTGVGYDLIRNARTEWTLNSGLGYQFQRLDSVAAGEDKNSDYPYASLGTRIDHELTDTIDFLFDYSLRLLNDKNGLYTHHMVTKLSFDLVYDLDLDVSVIWDRIEKPAPNDQGIEPKPDDYQMVVSLAYDF